MNGYRNWHFQISNDLKRIYCESLEKELKGKILSTPIDITFTLYKKTKRKTDRSNILSIIEKFFCDALVEYGCIIDDNDDYIGGTHYKTGGIDRENPRVEILIN